MLLKRHCLAAGAKSTPTCRAKHHQLGTTQTSILRTTCTTWCAPHWCRQPHIHMFGMVHLGTIAGRGLRHICQQAFTAKPSVNALRSQNPAPWLPVYEPASCQMPKQVCLEHCRGSSRLDDRLRTFWWKAVVQALIPGIRLKLAKLVPLWHRVLHCRINMVVAPMHLPDL